jgi:hypothetical protein
MAEDPIGKFFFRSVFAINNRIFDEEKKREYHCIVTNIH